MEVNVFSACDWQIYSEVALRLNASDTENIHLVNNGHRNNCNFAIFDDTF